MAQNRKICVGIFLGSHGVRGQVRLGSYTDDPEAIFDYVPLSDEKGTRNFNVMFKGMSKKAFIASVEGVMDRDASDALRGVKLYVDRDKLPNTEEDTGEYYYSDLLGLKVKDQTDAEVGEVQAVHDFGAGDLLEIRPSKGKSFMLPFKDAFVPVVDVEAGFVQVNIPEDWLTEEKPPKEKKTKRKSKPEEEV